MAEDWKPMTTLSEAFDHVVYWWDRLFADFFGHPEPKADFPPLRVLDLPSSPHINPFGGAPVLDSSERSRPGTSLVR
jgi:hypothetical protein